MKRKHFTTDEMKRIFIELDQDPEDRYNLLIEVLAQTGMRIDELCKIQVSDISRHMWTVTLHQGSKNGDSRTLPLGMKLTHKILRLVDKYYLGPHALLFELCAVRRGSIDTFTNHLRRKFRMLKARIFAGERLPCLHGFRHTKAKQIYEQTRDIYLVKAFLGHKSILSTEVYMPGINADKLLVFATR